MIKNSIISKIKLQAHRLRCSQCFAIDTDFLFVVERGMKYRVSFERPKINKPVFTHPQEKTLRMNKTQSLEETEVLVRICLLCGDTRKTSLSKSI